MAAGVWTGVGFSNLKNVRTRIKKSWNRSGVGSENGTPATGGTDVLLPYGVDASSALKLGSPCLRKAAARWWNEIGIFTVGDFCLVYWKPTQFTRLFIWFFILFPQLHKSRKMSACKQLEANLTVNVTSDIGGFMLAEEMHANIISKEFASQPEGPRGQCPPKFLEHIVFLCFDRRYPKQNSVICLKSSILPPRIFWPLPYFWSGYDSQLLPALRKFKFLSWKGKLGWFS